MSRRAKIIIAIVLLLLLALIAALFLLRPAPVTPVVNDPMANGNANVNVPGTLPGGNQPGFNVNVNQPVVNEPVTPAPVQDPYADLKNTAKTFAELFGSFSSEGNYQNIVDAQYYMTATVRAWAETYVAEQRAKPRSAEFSGTTTRAIFDPEVPAYDEAAGTATVIVNTRRIETGSTIGNQSVYYQTLTLEFRKEGATWKVDRFTWGAR